METMPRLQTDDCKDRGVLACEGTFFDSNVISNEAYLLELCCSAPPVAQIGATGVAKRTVTPSSVCRLNSAFKRPTPLIFKVTVTKPPFDCTAADSLEKEFANFNPSIGKSCKKDNEVEKVKELAKDNGWKACPGCQTMISRDYGCGQLPIRNRSSPFESFADIGIL